MNYIEMSTDEAIEILKKSKGKKVLISLFDLESEGVSEFISKSKNECFAMITAANTIAAACDDFVKSVNLFSEKQVNFPEIERRGILRTILLRE